MAGLGEKGKAKIAAPTRLFTPTESVVEGTNVRPRSKVNKNFQFPDDLAEGLREYAYQTRKKEVTIVVEALRQYLEAKTGQHFGG